MKLAPYIPIRDVVIFPGIITPIFIGRGKSIRTLEKALIEDNKIALFLQKDKQQENPSIPKDIYNTGILASIIQTVKVPNGTIKVLLESKTRVKFISDASLNNQYYEGEYEEILPEIIDENTAEALKRKVILKFEEYGKITNKILPDIILNIKGIKSIIKVLDIIASNIIIAVEKKQEIIEIENIEERAYKILEILNKEIEIATLERKIDSKVKEQMNSELLLVLCDL